MQSEVTAAAASAAQGTLHPLSTNISGRDITVSGIANDAAERDQILSALNDVNGRRVVHDDLRVLDTASPFALTAVKTAEEMRYTGVIPTEADRARLAPRLGAAATDLDLMSGAPDANWTDVALKGLDSLEPLEDGSLNIVDQNVTLTGTAFSPAEADAAKAALNALPEGYTSRVDIETRDDGKPVNFDVTYTAADGASLAGKLPANTDADDIAAALSLQNISGETTQGLLGDGTSATEQLTAISNWLPELDSMTFNSTDGALSLEAVTAPGVDLDLVQAGLIDDLGPNANITLSAPSTLPADGATRTNQATNRVETFIGGYWLPVFEFTANAENCDAQTAAALKSDRVSFVTGSARLNAQSVRALNAVAAIVRTCLSETDLTVEVGGHTDSQGGDDLNLELSQARADAVRSALIARGVADTDITSKGYGEAVPIADNETEDGRAANRRTTMTWLAPVAQSTEAATPAASPAAADTLIEAPAPEGAIEDAADSALEQVGDAATDAVTQATTDITTSTQELIDAAKTDINTQVGE
jgi:OOP family OmpA-OmpF porin